jgi:hypothetical protein
VRRLKSRCLRSTIITAVLCVWSGSAWAVDPFLSLPFQGATVHVEQGWRYSWGSLHRGMDYPLERGHAVRAAADGRAIASVRIIKGQESYGRFVLINHENGFTTIYAHLERVAPGIQELDFESDNVPTRNDFGVYADSSGCRAELMGGIPALVAAERASANTHSCARTAEVS